MEFISDGNWWIILVLLFITCFMGSVGAYKSAGDRTDSFRMISGFLVIGTIIAAFIFTGWQGGLTILVLSFVFSFIIFSVFSRGRIRRKPEHLAPISLDELMDDEWEKRDNERLQKIAHNPKIRKLLEEYGVESERHFERIDQIRQLLELSGFGDSWKTIEKPKRLKEYLRLEATGASPPAIAYALMK